MKTFARNMLVKLLGWQVRRLRAKHTFKIVAVVGSIGKTSTKLAIAQVLGATYRVQYQQGNYNHPVTVPLIFFGHDEPSLFNIFAWVKILMQNELKLRQDYPYDVVIVELGTDGPGQLQEFVSYLHIDIGVVTAIAPEHMEFFKTIEAVAAEELSIGQFTDDLLINTDLCDRKYYQHDTSAITYGKAKDAEYRVGGVKRLGVQLNFTLAHNAKLMLTATAPSISEMQLYSLTAATAVGDQLGLTTDELLRGIEAVKPVSGRLQLLEGINKALIIDDTYNASPEAMKSALETLYSLRVPRRIALLGNMNELGDMSEDAHREIGEYCDPSKLDLVVTLGPDANAVLALAAKQRGCKVKVCSTPYEAAEVLRPELSPGTVLLAKGSQNKVFAEEAVKQLLKNPKDASKLVRQSQSWMKIKQRAFPKPRG